MLPAFHFNKLFLIAFIGCCGIPFTLQQRGFNQFNQFNQFQPFRPAPNLARPPSNTLSSESSLAHQNWLNPGQELLFATTTARPRASVVFVNNQPAIPTMVPFIPAATTPTPEFLDCFSRCPTTSEFNPICANNRQVYGNEQKFNCARRCGADVEIVRRGSCEGLFPMFRG